MFRALLAFDEYPPGGSLSDMNHSALLNEGDAAFIFLDLHDLDRLADMQPDPFQIIQQRAFFLYLRNDRPLSHM